jgi:hypothetical protein
MTPVIPIDAPIVGAAPVGLEPAPLPDTDGEPDLLGLAPPVLLGPAAPEPDPEPEAEPEGLPVLAGAAAAMFATGAHLAALFASSLPWAYGIQFTSPLPVIWTRASTPAA